MSTPDSQVWFHDGYLWAEHNLMFFCTDLIETKINRMKINIRRCNTVSRQPPIHIIPTQYMCRMPCLKMFEPIHCNGADKYAGASGQNAPFYAQE